MRLELLILSSGRALPEKHIPAQTLNGWKRMASTTNKTVLSLSFWPKKTVSVTRPVARKSPILPLAWCRLACPPASRRPCPPNRWSNFTVDLLTHKWSQGFGLSFNVLENVDKWSISKVIIERKNTQWSRGALNKAFIIEPSLCCLSSLDHNPCSDGESRCLTTIFLHLILIEFTPITTLTADINWMQPTASCCFPSREKESIALAENDKCPFRSYYRHFGKRLETNVWFCDIEVRSRVRSVEERCSSIRGDSVFCIAPAGLQGEAHTGISAKLWMLFCR